MKNNRMFLVEKGTYIVVRDGKKEVSFISFDEFNQYYPSLDLTGKNYIDYEPDRNLFIDDSDETISIKDAPVKDYEDVINSIDTLIENKNDQFFGLTVSKAKELKIEQLKSSVSGSLYNKWPLFKQINIALGIYDEATKQECIDDIQSYIDYVDIEEEKINKLKTVKSIKEK